MEAIEKYYLLMACFFTDCSFKALANCQRSNWCINGVKDTGNACIAGVIDTGECMLCRCHCHGEVGNIYCLVSMTPVMHDVTSVNDTGDASPVSLTPANTCIAGVIDTGKCMLCRCQ
jgi:hypothetical protein